jgi:uncharacterized membrane protein YoaK (UPF0700 family)
MDKKDWSTLSNAEMLEEKKKLKKSKLFHALWIGFMLGILIYGLVNWAISPDKNIAFLLPMLLLVGMIRNAFKENPEITALEEELKRRHL